MPEKQQAKKTWQFPLENATLCIVLSLLLLSGIDCSAGANICTSAAVNASVGIDRILLAFADCSAGAFVNTCSACNTIVANYISHSCKI